MSDSASAKNVTEYLRLPHIIADGMILQRDADARLWGWAKPGSRLRLQFGDFSRDTLVDSSGEWFVVLPPTKAGGPYELELESEGEGLVVRDILVGDVFVFSGQSNFTIPMSRLQDLYGEEIATCDNDSIRGFVVPDAYDFVTPRNDTIGGEWKKSNRDTIMGFSACGYFFARRLYEETKVPIGFILSSIGGAPIEAWMSEDILKAYPGQYEIALKFRDKAYHDKLIADEAEAALRWHDFLAKNDEGLRDPNWHSLDLDDSAWQDVEVPGYFDEGPIGAMNGVAWFRKEIDLPESLAGKAGRIYLGRIVDSDESYINGTKVGAVTYQYPPRRYEFGEGILRAGKNVVALRVKSNTGRGGFIRDKPYCLLVGKERIELAGTWKARVGAKAAPLPEATQVRCQPLGLFNAMLSPLLPYSIKAILWYQGETNADRPTEELRGYTKLLADLIADWRSRWGLGAIPFIFAQLPNYMEACDSPCDGAWARLREAQRKALEVENTAMVVTIDLGEWNDLHPFRKREVGYRLALAALKLAYGRRDLVSSGPEYESFSVEGNKIRLKLASAGSEIGAGSELIAKGKGELRHFAIAGADKKYFWASAKIEGGSVLVWNEAIPKPVSVRYAWANNPEGANLYNKEGLPASPFSTDEE